MRELIINDEKRFYSKIWLYRSFIYKNTKFISKVKDFQVNECIKALNIKNNKERISFIIDSACDFIDNKHKGENICGFKDCKCFIQRLKKKNQVNGCCRYCKYVSSTGCTSKSVACKLFNCSEVTNRYDMVEYKDLKMLKVLSPQQRMIVKHGLFTPKEQIIKDIQPNLLIYGAVRLLVVSVFLNILPNYIRSKRGNHARKA